MASAVEEFRRMAGIGGIGLDVITPVMRSMFTDEEIREAYAEATNEFRMEVERGILVFYPKDLTDSE